MEWENEKIQMLDTIKQLEEQVQKTVKEEAAKSKEGQGEDHMKKAAIQ